MVKYLIILATFSINASTYSQKVEDLKKSSENHTKSSSSKSGNSNNQGSSRGSGNSGSGSSGNGYSEIDPSCLLNGCSLLFDIFSGMDGNQTNSSQDDNKSSDEPEPQKNEKVEPYKNPPSIAYPDSEERKLFNSTEKLPKKVTPENPYEKFYVSIRGSFYPANYQTWIPEITFTNEHYSFSARLLSIAEQRLDKVDYYSTFDVQPIQINFVNNHNLLFKIGIGGMAETFSDKVYFEFTTNLKWRIGDKFDMGIEGRMASNNGIVRQEASTYLNYAFWQKNNKQFLLGLNGMISQYYQTVNINTFGFSAGFRF